MSIEAKRIEPTTIWNKNYICVWLANLMLFISHFSIHPLIATYTEYLGANPTMIGVLAGMFFAVSLVFRPFSGPVATKFDKKSLLVFVFLLGAVTNLGYALFQNIQAFMFFRIFHGIQFSLIGIVLMTLVADNTPKDKFAYGMSIYATGLPIASASGPIIGDNILRYATSLRDESFGFSVLFLFGSAVLFLCLIPTFMISSDSKTKEDVARAGKWYTQMFSIKCIGPTALLFLLIMPHAFIGTYMFDFGREQGIGGISVFYTVLAVTMVIIRPILGKLTDKVGLPVTVLPAFLSFAAAMFVIASSTSLGMLILAAVLVALGMGVAQPSVNVMCIQMETPMRRSVATNTLHFGMDTGLFLGPVIGGVIRQQAGFQMMFRAGAISLFIAAALFVFVFPIYKKRLAELETL